MSVKPCKFYDIRSGKPVLIGDYDAALDFLVKNPDVMDSKPANAISSLANRFRGNNATKISLNIKGPNGAVLTSYEWANEEVAPKQVYNGKVVAKAVRVSDWKEAAANAETGRSIVHKFTVKLPDGTQRTVSAESLPSALGYTSKEFEDVFPNAKNILQSVAKLRMREQSLIDYLDSVKPIEKEAESNARQEQEKQSNAEKKRIADEWKKKKDELEPLINQSEPQLAEILQKELDKGPEVFNELGFGEFLFDELYGKNLKELGVSRYDIRDAQMDLNKTRDKIENKYKQLAEVVPESSATPDVMEVEGKPEPKPEQPLTAKEKLAQAHEKWLSKQNKQGIIFDPKSQAENDIEFLKAILSYIKEEAITTYENFKKALKEFGVYDESKDADWKELFDKENPKAEPQPEGELKERKTITSIKEAQDVSDAVKEALGGDRTKYEVLPNEVSAKEAKAIVDALGVEKAKALVLDGSTKIRGAFRTTVAQVLIKKYNELGDLSNAVSVAEGIAEMATDWGQAIQALSLFQYLTPEGQLLAAQRTINKLREKKFAKHKDQIDKIGKELKKANKDAVDEAVDKVVGRMGEIRTPPPVRRAKEYGAGNKIVTKTVYQKALSELKKIKFFSGADPSQLALIAAYHIEAGARSFSDFSKEMIKDLGKKVRPYLKSTYKAAQKDLGGEGYSTDDEIAKYLTTGIEADIKSAMKELGVDVGKIIKAHYTEAESAKTSLVEKLTADLGLDQSDAEMIAKAVEAEFNKIATDKKQKALQKLFPILKRRSPEYKTLEKKLIELSNLGAFDESDLRETYAEALGFPKLTEENAKEIKRLAEKVQKAPEGLFKHRATEDLLKYQAKLKGVDLTEVPLAIWMASVLSGPSTHAKNVVANTANAVMLSTSMIAQNPKSTVGIAKALGTGFMKGFIEALDVLATGYSPIKDKAQVPDVLEQKTFWGGKINPFNYYKGVRRAMIASDVVVFEMLKEARAFQLAYIQGKSTNEALKILNNTSGDIQIAKDKAHAEYEEIVANINANTELSPSEKKEQISMAKLDSKRRFYDFLHQLRPEEITSAAHEFAEKGTLNHKPQGLLGVGANAINQIAQQMPWVRFIVPFTNVITNAANTMMDYSLIGAARANTRTGSLFGQGERNITAQEKKDLYAKAIMGTTATILAFVLSQPSDDDEEEPMLQITADGYNDYGKNQDLKAKGWQPFSIKIGDTWVSYQYTPLFFALAPVGALRDYQQYHKGKIDDDYMDEWSFMFAAAFQAGLKTAGYLESVNGFLSAVLNAREGQKLFDKGASWLGKAGMAVLPVVGTNFYQQLMNDYYSAMKSPEKEARNEWYGKLLRNIPYAREGLKNAVNGLGEELPADTDILLSSSRGLPSDKLWTLLSKNKANTGLTAPSRTTIISEDGTEKIMTSDEYYKFAKYRGEFIKEALEENYDKLSGMDEKKFTQSIKKIKAVATPIAKARVRNPEIDTYKEYRKFERNERKENKKEKPDKAFSEKRLLKSILND